jgi:outer membrane protein assembly factor BamB
MIIALFLVFTTLTCLPAVLPAVHASNINTYARLLVTPNPVGVNQTVSVKFYLDNAPPVAFTGNRYQNFSVTIKKPDGTTETKGPYTSDIAGTALFTYTPTMTGTYTLQFSFPGQTFGQDYYLPSKSNPVNLTVQAQAVPTSAPTIPLPTSYWTRPINAENQQWYSISGNWLMQCYNLIGTFAERGVYAPYTLAPSSAHIMWTKELSFGGIVGGESGSGVEYYAGLSYEHKLQPPVIMDGRLYYNEFPSSGVATVSETGVVCVDLRTGEVIWQKDDMMPILFGQTFNFNSPNQHGALGYLWAVNGSNWLMYDAYSGTLLVTFQNATTSPGSYNTVYGPNGEILAYTLDGTNDQLSMWNSTLAIGTQFFGYSWRPGLVPVLPWNAGIQWNVSEPKVAGDPSIGLFSYDNNMLIAEATLPGNPYPTFEDIGYNALTGAQVWVQNRTNVGWGIGGQTIPGLLGFGNTQPREGVYVFFQEETMQWHCIDILTGKELWVTKPLIDFTNSSFSIEDWPANIVNGILYAGGESGCLSAFNLTNGNHLWTFSVGQSSYTPSGTWPIFGGSTVADGKIYFTTGGHFPGEPMTRGNRLFCLNATTGSLIWSVDGWFVGANSAIADGYLTAYNAYDNQLYCFGTGPSKTTVTVPDIGVTTATPITITGSVTDISAGTQQNAVAVNFPNGLPCVSDASMSQFMEAVYMQQPMPTNVTGVPVTISVLDSNHNTRVIGTTTTNSFGTFAYTWTPNILGNYTLTATFAGSNSYYGSSADTYFYASAPPATTATPAASVANTYFVPAIAGLFVLIIIVLALVVLSMLRKRP